MHGTNDEESIDPDDRGVLASIFHEKENGARVRDQHITSLSIEYIYSKKNGNKKKLNETYQ